jgi:carbon-monoxide dehydrogenase medium subunit
MTNAEAALLGTRDDDGFAAAAAAAAADVDPIADVRGSRPYKREMVRVFVKRALHRASTAEDR